MKPWAYYATPVKSPWVTPEEIKTFRKSVRNKYIISQWIFQRDEDTRNELYGLELEFREDACKELGITKETYDRLDPYDAIIGCPENHDPPSIAEYESMFMWLLMKTEKS